MKKQLAQYAFAILAMAIAAVSLGNITGAANIALKAGDESVAITDINIEETDFLDSYSFSHIDGGVVVNIDNPQIGFRQIVISVTKALREKYIVIYRKNLNECGLQGVEIQSCLNTESNFKEDELAGIDITFVVKKDWLANSNIDESAVNLYLYRADKWEQLPTKILRRDDTYVYYEAQTPVFSKLAIAGKQNIRVASFEENIKNLQFTKHTLPGIFIGLIIITFIYFGTLKLRRLEK